MSRRRKKNPSTAQWVIIGVASAAALGAVGYGVYRATKKDEPEALGAGGPAYEYSIEEGIHKGNGRRIFTARIRPQGKEKYRWRYVRYSRGQARARAEEHIRNRGGVPVEIDYGG